MPGRCAPTAATVQGPYPCGWCGGWQPEMLAWRGMKDGAEVMYVMCRDCEPKFVEQPADTPTVVKALRP